MAGVEPTPREYLSFLMGASAISDAELTGLGATIVERIGSGVRCLLVPAASLAAYRALIAEKLQPGFWNDLIGPNELLFVFKLADGTVRELADSPETRMEIAQLCSRLNGDPLEKTSDLPRYLAGNRFYRDAMRKWHGVAPS